MYRSGDSWGVERPTVSDGRLGPDRQADLAVMRKWLDKALVNETRWTTDDLLLLIIQGKMQVFLDEHGIVLTEIIVTRDKRLLVFLLGGEKIHLWKDRMNERLKAYAKERGCVCIETWARLDAEGRLKQMGYVKEQVVMRHYLES